MLQKFSPGHNRNVGKEPQAKWFHFDIFNLSSLVEGVRSVAVKKTENEEKIDD